MFYARVQSMRTAGRVAAYTPKRKQKAPGPRNGPGA